MALTTLTLALATPALAQQPDSTSAAPAAAAAAAPAAAPYHPAATARTPFFLRPPQSISFFTAVARDQIVRARVGHIRGRDFYIAGLRAAWPLRARGPFRLSYVASLLPAVVSSGMPVYDTTFSWCPPDTSCRVTGGRAWLLDGRETIYGAGVAPLGFELRLGAGGPIALAASASAGAVYFSRPVPDPSEKRLNFIGDVGLSLELRPIRPLWLTAGFRLDHISNANTGPVNPGMNSRMLELGLTLAR